MKDLVKVNSSEELTAMRTSIGQSEKRVKNSAQEFVSMPQAGVFHVITTKEFDIPEVGKRNSLGLLVIDNNGNEIGFVSENAINAQKLLDQLTEIKNGTRKGKYALKSVRLSDLNSFGNSANARLIALQGKKFKATKVQDCIVYKSEYLDEKKFDEVCSTTNSATAVKEALKKTELKDLYTFEIEG